MVYGLNVVTANRHLYGSKPLNGNIAAIRSIDQTPNGGMNFESVYGGRRCHTEHFPTKMKWEGPRDSLIGDFNDSNLLNVSESARALIERFEPGVHQFIPVDYVDGKGSLIEKRYFWVVCNRIDSIDRECTTFILRKGKMWRPVSDIADFEPELLPPDIDPDTNSKFVFSLAQIGDAHAWRDKHMDTGGVWISKAFGDALKKSGLTGLKLSDNGMESV